MRHLPLIGFACSLFVMLGCNKPQYSATSEFETGCWQMQDTLQLSFDNQDTSQVYALWFPIVFNEDYSFNNIHLRATLKPPTSPEVLLRARFALMDADGKWMTEKEGNTIPFDLQMSSGLRLNQIGEYKIRLYHYMRDSSLCGIASAGIALDKAIAQEP